MRSADSSRLFVVEAAHKGAKRAALREALVRARFGEEREFYTRSTGERRRRAAGAPRRREEAARTPGEMMETLT